MKYLLLKQMESGNESDMSREISKMDNENVIMQSKYFQNYAAKKSKRFRSAFTTEQINYLEREFRKFPYIGSANRKEVASKLKIPERAVKIWFQNRRMKEKKEVANKEFDSEDPNKYITKFINEPLNNGLNWQSNNGRRDCPDEQTSRSQTGLSKRVITQTATNSPKSHEKLCLFDKPTVKPNEDRKVSLNSRSNSTFVTNRSSINTDAAIKNVKNEPNATFVDVNKQKKACTVPSKNQNKNPVSCYPITKRSNIDQDMPQDLSSRRILNKMYSQQPHRYPVNTVSGTEFMPLHMQNSYPIASLPASNIMWKPINMLSAVPGIPTSAVPMTIPHNSAGVHLVNHNIKNSCSCSCNCHGALVRGFNQVDTGAHPQYIIAIPLNNNSK